MLARFYKGAQRVNGTGTAFFGHLLTPDGYIATKWISLFHIPLLPVQSYEILHSEPSKSLYYFIFYEEDTTLFYRPVSLCLPQVLKLGWVPVSLLLLPPAILTIL